MVYGLGRRGAQALRQERGNSGETDWTERNKRAGAKFIEHTLAIADLLVRLELACRAREDVSMLSENELLADAPEQTRRSREPLRLTVAGVDNGLGVSSVIPDALFGLAFKDQTESYFALEMDRSSMPVSRSRFDRTSFLRKLHVYLEAFKQGRHIAHYGLQQVRVLTVTDSRKRIDNMLAVLDELTGSKGSHFFLFGTFGEANSLSPLDVAWTNGRGEIVKLTD
jgi:hypothetical protein